MSEQVPMPLVCEHAKEHLLVNVLCSKRIHENRSPRLVSLHKSRALIDLFQQLGSQNAAIDHVDPELAVVELALANLKLPWVSNGSRVVASLEVLLEQLKLSLRRLTFEIYDGDSRPLPLTSNAAVNREQGSQHVTPAVHRPNRAPFGEFAHQRHLQKNLGVYILVRDACRTFGVQLYKLVVGVGEKRVQA